MQVMRSARGVTVIVSLVAVALLVGSCCGRAPVKKPPSPVWTVEVTPVEDTNPTKTQHTFIATVFDRDRRPLPNVQVHWILARTGDAVGDIVCYDDQDLGVGMARALTRKTDNFYAVSYTNEMPATLHAGMRWKPDPADRKAFEVLPGQTWCTITSPVEGDSHMIVYVPAIEDARCHKVFAIKHWRPQPSLTVTKECPAEVPADTPFEYVITVTNTGDGPAKNVTVTEQLPDVNVTSGPTFPHDLGDIGAGESKSIRMTVVPSVSPVAPGAGNYTATIDVNCGPKARYELGEMIPFSVSVTNNNAETIDGCTVEAAISGGISTDLSADGGTVSGNTVQFSIPALAPSQTVTRTFRATAVFDTGNPSATYSCTASVQGSVTVGGVVDLRNVVEARTGHGQGEFYARAECLTRVTGQQTSAVGASDQCTFQTMMGVPSLTQKLEDWRNGQDTDNFALNEPFNYVLMLENEGQLRLGIEMTFTLSAGLELAGDQIGLIGNESSTTVTTPLQWSLVGEANGVKTYRVALKKLGDDTPMFLSSAREAAVGYQNRVYIYIPVRGTVLTTSRAEKISFDITWTAHDSLGDALNMTGDLTIGQTTWIGRSLGGD